MLSNQSIISPLGIIFETLWISSEIFSLVFDTVKPSVTSCSGDVHKFIAPGFKLCSLLLILDLSLFHCIEHHLVLLWQQHGGQSTYSWPLAALQISEITHAGFFLILPVSFIHLGVSTTPWTLSSLPSPFPESLFLLSLMLCVWFLLCRASSRQAWLHAQWFSRALRPRVNFKLRTCWSAPLNRDQIIHVLKDKHLLKYFAEFRPKHTH